MPGGLFGKRKKEEEADDDIRWKAVPPTQPRTPEERVDLLLSELLRLRRALFVLFSEDDTLLTFERWVEMRAVQAPPPT